MHLLLGVFANIGNIPDLWNLKTKRQRHLNFTQIKKGLFEGTLWCMYNIRINQKKILFYFTVMLRLSFLWVVMEEYKCNVVITSNLNILFSYLEWRKEMKNKGKWVLFMAFYVALLNYCIQLNIKLHNLCCRKIFYKNWFLDNYLRMGRFLLSMQSAILWNRERYYWGKDPTKHKAFLINTISASKVCYC